MKDLLRIIVILIVNVINLLILENIWILQIVNKLVEECSENIDGNEMIHNNYGKVCNSSTIYLVLFVNAFLIIIGFSSVFVYFHWYLEKDNTIITNLKNNTETIIY